MEIVILFLLLVVLCETSFLFFRSLRKTPLSSKKPRRKVFVDTSALIDGRILSIAQSGFLGDEILIPRSVIRELQLLADGNDAEKRLRARFGMDIANELERVLSADVEIFSEDIPGWLVANEGRLTVALEVTVTEDLRREGVARELVNRIQNIRKSSGFEITDKINITLSKNTQTDDAVNEYKDYICNQVLATSLMLVDEVQEGTELNFDDFSLFVKVEKN